MNRLILAVLAAPLAACSQEPAANNGAEAAPPAAQASGALASVDLTKPISGSGANPAWTIEIDGSQIRYAEGGAAPEAFAPAAPSVDVMAATYATRNAKGEDVVVMLSPVSCEGPAGGAARPLTVQMKIGAQIREGCAGPAQ
ncbi:hypothetical protein [Sphingomonas sp. G-3-2-10]|uniref:hypothetical protein n=1 Tax=Sphingomonas sp. G-3-2-10 TaxID=2728838 RepID=UPI00146DE0CE|nr:hypothetical protein [Sphingomonas sp. G-3-2-10]NML05568.1 hypothetical protein [Sphingomonas sp. G-3-2-10]